MARVEGTLTQKAASGVAWSTVLQVSRQALSLLSVSVLAHMVPPGAYGMVSMAGVVITFFATFQDLGTTTALVRQTVLTERLTVTVFWINCIFGLLLAGCSAALSSPVAAFFHQPDLAVVTQTMALYFVLTSLGVLPNALLMRQMEFRHLAIAQFSGAVAGTATAISLALLGKGVWSLVIGALANNAATTMGYWVFAPFRLRWLMDMRSIRSIISYSLNLSGYGMINYFTRNADNLIVGRFLGTVPLGYYQMGYTLLTFPLYNFSDMIGRVLFPALAQVQEDDERIRRAFVRTSILIALFTFPAMLGLLVTADLFVRVVLGPKWLPVTRLLMVFAPLGMAQSVVTVSGLIYYVKARTDWLFRWGCLSGALFVLSFFLGLRWGIQGVATSYAIMWSILALPGLSIPLRLIHLPLVEYLHHLWPVLKPALVMTAVAAVWLHGLRWLGVLHPMVLFCSTLAVGVVCYVALLFWWRPPVIGELRNLLEHSGNLVGMKVARYLPASRGELR